MRCFGGSEMEDSETADTAVKQETLWAAGGRHGEGGIVYKRSRLEDFVVVVGRCRFEILVAGRCG